MRSLFIFLLFIFGGLFLSINLPPAAHAAKIENIAATVDEEAISTSELQDRLRLIMLSTGQKPSKEVLRQLTPQILGSLIDEQLQLQEAKRLNLKVSAQEIRTQFEQISKRNKIPPEKFEKMLTGNGVNFETMRNQIRAQIAWAKVVQAKLRPQVKITENDIQNHTERFTRSIGKEEYQVAKILLPVNDDEKDADIKNLAEKLIAQIKAGKARFSRIAREFSKAPGALQGGAMGWVQEGQLGPALNDILPITAPGTIAPPVRLNDGYHILFVRDKRTVEESNIPTKEQITSTLGQMRLDRLQRRYLLDLKAAAFIDVRI